ncbi:MAG: COX15/CtaA family protein [Nitrosopumilus sp.]|nr:COX15/CtaA family protein [Nitrosopumilus sp.]
MLVVILVLLGLIFSLMMLGVYLSSVGQGLSCLTWPTCPNGFNFPPQEYLLEHFHRSMVLVVAIFLYSFTAFSFLRIGNKNFKVKLIIASVLLTTQIILGWVMILTKLNPIVVASHLSTAVALFGILLVTLLSVYNELQNNKVKN